MAEMESTLVDGIAIDGRMATLCIDACCEIEELAEMIADAAPNENQNLALRGLALRIKQLNGNVLSALSRDQIDDTKGFEVDLLGLRGAERFAGARAPKGQSLALG